MAQRVLHIAVSKELYESFRAACDRAGKKHPAVIRSLMAEYAAGGLEIIETVRRIEPDHTNRPEDFLS